MKLHITPTARELVEAVREFLENQVMPGTTGHLSFHARVAANVLRTVERELEREGEDAWAAELLGTVDAESEADLCERIAAAPTLDELAELVPVLEAITRARLEAYNPKYLAAVDDDDPTKEAPA